MSKETEIGLVKFVKIGKSSINWFKMCQNWLKFVRIYQNKQVYKYIPKPKKWPNEYPDIF